MIELSAAFPKIPGPTPDKTAAAPARAGFTLTLATFLDRALQTTLQTVTGPSSGDERQGLAEDGKKLPTATEDDGEEKPDPALLWLPIPLPPIPAAKPIAIALPAMPVGLPADLPALLPAEPASVASPAKTGAQLEAAGDLAPALPDGPAPQIQPPVKDSAPESTATADKSNKHIPQAAPPAVTIEAPVAKPQNAARIFAQAIAAATVDTDRNASPAEPQPAAAPATPRDVAVQATDKGDQAPLDLRQERGLAKMIDHIEQLRDNADSTDTRIRLIPDALGGVDVSVRKDGDSVHVRFAAEKAETRTLLADAQPRLTELAEARGVKIAGATVDAGGAGANPQRRPQETARPQQTRPRPAATPSTLQSGLRVA